MASHQCPFCDEEYGCEHLIGEGEDEIKWFWSTIEDLKRLSEDANDLRLDIGKIAKGIRGFQLLTPETQCWWEDYVPDVIVNAPGIHLVADHYDFGGPASGSWYGVFIDPRQRKKIEREFDRLVERLYRVTAPRGAVS